jgi:hypothetical protein
MWIGFKQTSALVQERILQFGHIAPAVELLFRGNIADVKQE